MPDPEKDQTIPKIATDTALSLAKASARVLGVLAPVDLLDAMRRPDPEKDQDIQKIATDTAISAAKVSARVLGVLAPVELLDAMRLEKGQTPPREGNPNK